MIIVVPFSIDEPTKASWDISVTADVNCICTVTALFPPLPPQTCYGIRGGEDSSMTARGLRIMVDMMSRTDRLKMLCVEPGTHPEERDRKRAIKALAQFLGAHPQALAF